MQHKGKTIDTRTVVGGKTHEKARQPFYNTSGAQNTFGAGWHTRLINGTVIYVHARTSFKNRKIEHWRNAKSSGIIHQPSTSTQI